jgi:hypothetical protein
MDSYLADSEYQTYGLEPDTPASWVAAASSIIDAHCNRPTLLAQQFIERVRLVPDRNVLRLTYLPLSIPQGETSPLVSGRARYGIPRRGEDLTMWETATEYAQFFGLPGTWIGLDVTNFDFFCDTGEVSWLPNPLGMYFDEMELTYTGGFTTIPDPVKFACVQLVRNAQAMPALNVREGTLNAMHFAYFADSLVDATVQQMLAPYVAQKVA